ncbi:MAG: alkaline phosphatase family protein, partial [Caldilineaceae bacterium]|nr:alkaline phosphatase family protein [Caldilineaceae bacterium]
MKKVLLIIIDALASRVVDPAMDQGRLPNLRRLRAAADVRTNSIAVFPSITPAATTSLITGCYPGEHGISGAYWYIPDEKRVVYFGYDFWAILENGIGSFFDEFLLKLNTDHLRVKTLFQRVEEQGLSAASLNYLIYHGDHHHDLKLPPLQRLLPDAISDLLPSAAAATTVDGPTLLYFGDLVQTPLSDGSKLSFKGGITNRLGFTDDSSADMLVHMLDNDVLPDLTVAYFPGNDMRSHEVGPERALNHLDELD